MIDNFTQQINQIPLFKDKAWRWAPQPFALSKKQRKSLQGLGHKLAQFQQACHSLYIKSVRDPQGAYGWIAPVIDAGKPEELVAWNHRQVLANPQLGARVIRPDLLLQDIDKAQFALSEIDSVPGGIGVLAAMNQSYSALGFNVVGGASGMLQGMLSLGLGKSGGNEEGKGEGGGGQIWVSDESQDYRLEMQWLAEQLNTMSESEIKCMRAEEGSLETLKREQVLYRFFEMFDYANIPAAKKAVAQLATHDVPNMVAPMQYHLEEKLWLALFKLPSLRGFWQQNLRESHRQDLEELIPTSWWFKQQNLPVTAALPYLDIVDWQELKSWSQTRRQLVLKMSGFHELAWGGRSVHIGHDMSQEAWAEVIDNALADEQSQWVLQQFEPACSLEQEYYDEQGERAVMEGRARLCPYYFTNEQGKTALQGCLATVVPSDKKKIHGMSSAVLTPCQ